MTILTITSHGHSPQTYRYTLTAPIAGPYELLLRERTRAPEAAKILMAHGYTRSQALRAMTTAVRHGIAIIGIPNPN
ncbi:hypothetical protein [Actinomadura miaoliensis]|uniref:Uncharacterized protein n=1 Tax=Actinomadura miaoliensis TaxID=430685 RepID=A0ABP7X1H6_9ACTN